MNEIRNGRYGMYNGELYRIGKTYKNSVHLCSENRDDLRNGFTCDSSESFIEKYGFVCIKDVPKSEITEAYKIETYALYKGLKFDIIGSHQEGTNILLNLCGNQISSHNPSEEERKYEDKLIKIGFHMGIVDKTFYMYEKSVPMDDPELEIFEERTEIDINKL